MYINRQTHINVPKQTHKLKHTVWPGGHNNHVSWKMLAIGDLHYVSYCHLVARTQQCNSVRERMVGRKEGVKAGGKG